MTSSPRVLRWGAWTLGAVGGVAALWWALSLLLASDRGLDITDEGLYLMAADPPSLDAQWGFPWGWHTGALFRLVGYDIATFRTLGALILVLAGGWLGWAAARCAVVLSPSGDRSILLARATAVVGAVTGATGSLLYYHGLLRTPSYNWVNLVGILLASAATASWATRSVIRNGPSSDWRGWAWGLVSGFGMFVTLPAKPSTFPQLLVAGVAFLGFTIGWRPALRSGLIAGVSVVGYVAVAVLTGLWPREFVTVLERAVGAPKGFDQTLSGAVENVFILPVEFEYRVLEARPLILPVLAIVGIVVLGVAMFRRVSSSWVRGVGFGLVVLGAFGSLAVQYWSFPSLYPQELLVLRPIVTAGLLLLVATAAVAYTSPRRVVADGTGSRRRLWPLVVYLTSLPFIFGFGSSHGAYGMATAAAGVLFVVAVALSVRVSPVRMRGAVMGTILLLTLATVAGSLAQSAARPFRIPPVDENTTGLVATSRGSSVLVDGDLAAVITSLRQQADDHGWVSGTPMVGLAWKQAAAIPLLLGASLPTTLMTTLMGWEGSADLLTYNAEQDAGSYRYDEAWLLTSRTASLRPDSRVEVAANTDALSRVTGRPFPAGYQCVAAAGSFLLWKPTSDGSAGPADVGLAEATCPTAVPSASDYDAENGWFPDVAAPASN
jgi:hypothetical protein